ncbi:MazG-like family protein [Streptomyces sp. BBFR2]|uniref:MazG-like family protein n=1 Tax=Streptomyces sp. BBFR2 TaxID=3372854 RepID=UPI0037DA19AB
MAVAVAAGEPAGGSSPGARPPLSTDVWETVEALVAWLDRESALPPEQERLLRVLKLSEEAGEVAQAVIGTLGQNPRKGRSHTWEDVQRELCDVAVTALVALTTLTPQAREVFDGHLAGLAERLPRG